MFNIYRKELLELFRDKRTLLVMVLLPTVIGPLLLFLFSSLIAFSVQKAASKPLEYFVIGEQYAPELVRVLKDEESFLAVEVDEVIDSLLDEESLKTEINKLVQADTVQFVINIPATYQQSIKDNKQATVDLYFNNASLNNLVGHRLTQLLSPYIKQLSVGKLAVLGFAEDQREGLIEPVKFEFVNTADPRENWGEKIGGIIPYIFLLVCLTGAMYPAIDIGAGEKERGTLESLLLTPVPRAQIVLAKFCVILTTSYLTVFMLFVSISFWGGVALLLTGTEELVKDTLMSVFAKVSGMEYLLLVLMLLLSGVIFASTLLSVSIYAKSYKEAQNYLTPAMLIFTLLIVLSVMPGVGLDGAWAFMPLTNICLSIKELFKGTLDFTLLTYTLGSTLIIAAALLKVCTLMFNREGVIFRN